MFSDSESVKEYIVLWTYSEAVSDLVHVAPDVKSGATAVPAVGVYRPEQREREGGRWEGGREGGR